MKKELLVVIAIFLIAIVGFWGCEDNFWGFNKKSVTPVAKPAAPAVAQQQPVKPEAMAPATVAPPDMKVGTLHVDKIVAKESQTDLAKVKESRTGLAKVKESRTALAKVRKAEIREANINKATIKEAEIDKAKIKEAEIDKAKIRLAEIELAKIKLAEIDKAKIKLAEIELAKIKLAEIEEARIKLALIEEARIKKAEIEKANIGTIKKSSGSMATEPKVNIEKSSVCDQKGGCHGKVLTGSYQTLQPYRGVRLVSNSNNPRYPANSVTFKIEYHGGWGPAIVLRNIGMENPMQLVNANAGLMLSYLERAIALKKGKPGNEGDSCWEVVLLRDGTIYKNESPAEVAFRK